MSTPVGRSVDDIISEWLQGDLELELDLSHCNLTELPVSLPCHLVKRLNCDYNQLTSLSLPSAIYVWCEHNELTSLSLPSVTQVWCNNNQLTSLSLPLAISVWCEYNQLTSLSLPIA